MNPGALGGAISRRISGGGGGSELDHMVIMIIFWPITLFCLLLMLGYGLWHLAKYLYRKVRHEEGA